MTMRLPFPILLAAVVFVGGSITLILQFIPPTWLLPAFVPVESNKTGYVLSGGYYVLFVSGKTVQLKADSGFSAVRVHVFGGAPIIFINKPLAPGESKSFVYSDGLSGRTFNVQIYNDSNTGVVYYVNPFQSCSCIKCPDKLPAKVMRTAYGYLLLPDFDAFKWWLIYPTADGIYIYREFPLELLMGCAYHAQSGYVSSYTFNLNTYLEPSVYTPGSRVLMARAIVVVAYNVATSGNVYITATSG